MHPIRKQILKCPKGELILKFLKRHFNNCLDKNKLWNEIYWYFEQNERMDTKDDIFPNIGDHDLKFIFSKAIPNQIKEVMINNDQIMYNYSIIELYSQICLLLGDMLVDTYVLARMLRYIEDKNTDMVLFYGGWSHPYFIKNFFNEMLKHEIKFSKEYGRHLEYGNFSQSEEWYNNYKRLYTFNMPLKDFNHIFNRIHEKEEFKKNSIKVSSDQIFKLNKHDGFI